MEPSAQDLLSASENSTVNKVGNDASKVNKA